MIGVDVQFASSEPGLPPSHMFQDWARTATSAVGNIDGSDCNLAIRIVDQDESARLNRQYRDKEGATNVLSFPMTMPPGVPFATLGDLVICAPVVRREAREQDKDELAHWAHMVVHGVLHLHGFDHMNDAEAGVMEAQERKILGELGFADPYADN